jgi:GNAT superfamily N-acetyltransferase
MESEVSFRTVLDGVDWVALKARLAEDRFDNGRSPEQLRVSFENSRAVVLAWLGEEVVGTVRALSDGVCNAYVMDVWTDSRYRRRGIARGMMERLLEQLPGQHVYLFTDDARPFYEKLGFQPQDTGMGRVVGEWLQPGKSVNERQLQNSSEA